MKKFFLPLFCLLSFALSAAQYLPSFEVVPHTFENGSNGYRLIVNITKVDDEGQTLTIVTGASFGCESGQTTRFEFAVENDEIAIDVTVPEDANSGIATSMTVTNSGEVVATFAETLSVPAAS